MLIDLILVAMVLSAVIYAIVRIWAGEAKANSFLKWEWKQIKKFFKWVLELISKGFLKLAKAIKA